MSTPSNIVAMRGRRVLVPGGTGLVGEGVVRRYLRAGADVVVPTRTEQRRQDFQTRLGDDADARLHLVVHDYTSFNGSADLVAQMVENLGGVDDVVAPIGGWWFGKRLWEINEQDWQEAFLDLASTHVAVMRASLPHLGAAGAYVLVVGDSANSPVPGSGLVSMEQAALLMMSRVLRAELDGRTRVFTLVLGPVRSHLDERGGITADDVGSVAIAAATGPSSGAEIGLHDQDEVAQVLASLGASHQETSRA